MKNSVKKKTIFYIQIKTASPICVSKGDGQLTDNDVLRDFDGTPYIPGSSLAGAMRAYLMADSNVKCIFGNSETSRKADDDRMSSVFVSDLRFDSKVVTTVRDSVALQNKTAITGAKFDLEVIDTGALGSFTMELVIREADSEEKCLEEIKIVFTGLHLHEIRFGAKKTRGYGEVELCSIKSEEFTSSNILEYAKAYDSKYSVNLKEKKFVWLSDKAISKYTTIKVPLELDGCISIRQYSAKKNLPDYVHITANGLPVIPGTSIAGAIRHRISDFLSLDLHISPDKYIDTMFGYVDSDKGHRSMVTVGEAVLTGSKPIEITRNGISRFESGVKNTAFFKERSYYGGKTDLVIMVEKGAYTDATIGLFLLALKDIQNGMLSIGGQASVGKGVFKVADKIKIDEAEFNEEKYLRAAAEWIGGK